MRKLNTEDFISRAKIVHSGKYDYSKSIYTTGKKRLVITCPVHGDFEQVASAHLCGIGCNLCGIESSGMSRRISFDEFVERSSYIHEGRYSYNRSEYENASRKTRITCPIHGDFMQSPKKHLIGRGCHDCGGTSKSTTSDFIKKSILRHGYKYDYSKVEYVSSHDKILIVCKDHGPFLQSPTNHLEGKGCSGCADYGFKRTAKMACVYFLEAESFEVVKIGVTHNAKGRILKLKKSTPFAFNVIKKVKTSGHTASELESYFHKKFKSAELSGFDGCTEWVIKTSNLMAEIEHLPPHYQGRVGFNL